MEMQTRGPTAVALKVHGFTTEYRVNETTGEPYEVDFVEYSPRHKETATRLKTPVMKLLEVDPDEDPNNIIAAIARARASQIEPAYRAWKKGSEITVDGTPLGAWPGINPKQAEIFRHCGFSTVEEIASATRSQIMKVRLPNQADLQLLAKNFLAARGANVEAMGTSRLAEENDHLKSRLAEMDAQMARLSAMVESKAGMPQGEINTNEVEVEQADEELSILREMAKEAKIERYWVKGKDTLERELETMQAAA